MTGSVAFFDFDGTLTRSDSLIPFLRYVRGDMRLVADLIAVSPWLSAYAVGLLPNGHAKERLLRQALAGRRHEELCRQGAQFAQAILPRLVRDGALATVRGHQRRGHRCVLVSASLDVYLEPWARQIGFDRCIATRLERDDGGIVSGCLLEGNCYGDEKERRMRNLLDEFGDVSYTYAYGDSKGDRAMLSMVDEGYLINRNAREFEPLRRMRQSDRCG